MRNIVLSAKNLTDALRASGMSLVYMSRSRGESQELWGTPASADLTVESKLLTLSLKSVSSVFEKRDSCF